MALNDKPIGFVSKNSNFGFPYLYPQTETNKQVTDDTSASKIIKGDSAKINSLLFNSSNMSFANANIFGNMSTASIPEKTEVSDKRTEISGYKIDDQGATNSCGTTSLASVLKHFGANVKDHWEIDKSIRSTKYDMFTSPNDIVDYAKSKGFKAGLKNNSNIEEVASFVDKGVPVMMLIDPGDKYDFNMHWQVIIGYDRDQKGKISSVRIAQPGGGYIQNKDVEILKKEWQNIRVGSENTPIIGGKRFVNTGYNNLIIPIVPKNTTIKTPEGKVINTKDIKIPDEYDTIHGYGAQIVSKSAVVLERTVNASIAVKKYVSGTYDYLTKKIGW